MSVLPLAPFPLHLVEDRDQTTQIGGLKLSLDGVHFDHFDHFDHFNRYMQSQVKLGQTNTSCTLYVQAAAVQTTIPPSILPELMKELEVERWNCRCWGLVALNSQAGRLPPSGYTGGVDDIVASSCPRCEEWRQEAWFQVSSD